jgi:1-acyl-sn-glycerol-3-phosphate acyltransferase
MAEYDTSSYWRKLLELDKSVPPEILEKYRSWHRSLRPLFYGILTAVLRFYCPVKVAGVENLPDRPPYIIAANHASSMDYVCVAWAMGKRREELYPMATK